MDKEQTLYKAAVGMEGRLGGDKVVGMESRVVVDRVVVDRVVVNRVVVNRVVVGTLVGMESSLVGEGAVLALHQLS